MKIKEYKIQLTFSIESEEADYERVEQFAQELAESLIQDNPVPYDDIEIVEAVVTDVNDLNDYDDFTSLDKDVYENEEENNY